MYRHCNEHGGEQIFWKGEKTSLTKHKEVIIFNIHFSLKTKIILRESFMKSD